MDSTNRTALEPETPAPGSGRSRVSFQSGGVSLAGYLFRPAGRGLPTPGVVLATGFSGTQDTPSIVATAGRYTAAGFATLTFDYRGFGESGGEPRQVISIQGQLDDLRAAVRCLRSQEGIDPERIALWGTSLGGGHVIAVAAQDSRLAAVIAQIPFNGFPKKVEGRSTAATLRLLGAMFADSLRGRLRLKPYYIPAVGNQGELAVMASPQAVKTIEVLTSGTWRNQVAPRALVEMMSYKPGDLADQLTMPLLLSTAEFDRESNAELTAPIAQRAPQVEQRTYPAAHFDFYRPDIREQVLADQVDFLRRHLG